MKITCRLCKHAHGGFKKTIDGKLCRHANRLTSYDDEACPLFEGDGFLYCPSFRKWTHIGSCAKHDNRRKRSNPCKHCEFAENAQLILMLEQPMVSLRRK